MNPYITDVCREAIRDLLAQGEFGVNEYGTCAYLTPKGTSCIAGLIFRREGVPVEVVAETGGSFSDQLRIRPDGYSLITCMLGWLPDPWSDLHPDCINELQGLQVIHDYAAKWPWVENMREAIELACLGVLSEFRCRWAANLYMEVLRNG